MFSCPRECRLNATIAIAQTVHILLC
ncbi:hypothetical protein BVI1335_350052 [Burkholderia vietnamiensis]|nr:hypothetical protein BVI1335_350052 [Burkholderia vietnamiensis]